MSQIKVARILIFIATITLFVITYLGFQRINYLIDASNLVNETNVTRIQLEKTYGQLREADSELNSFLITGDTIFYRNFFNAEKNLEDGIARLFSQMRDNPQQCFRLYRVEKLIEEVYTLMDENIHGHDPSLQRKNITKINQLTDKIYAGIGAIEEEELALLEQREGIKTKQEKITPLIIFTLALFALAVMLFAYYRISKELWLRTRVQKELEIKNAELVHSNKELEHFAFGSSHDLQEPLRKIETFCSIIEHKNIMSESEEGSMLLNKIQSSARHMRTMVNDLLGFAHFYYSDDEKEMLNLNHIIEEVLQNFQGLIEEKNVVIKVGALPVLRGMRPQLYRLFQNLISNAIKYARDEPMIIIRSNITSAEEIMTKVTVKNIAGTFHHITVEDNGIGFEEEFSDKIFLMFQRLHDKRHYEGTGIGLAICKRVVQNHGGFIVADSVKGQGSVFHVYLPADTVSLELIDTHTDQRPNVADVADFSRN